MEGWEAEGGVDEGDGDVAFEREGQLGEIRLPEEVEEFDEGGRGGEGSRSGEEVFGAHEVEGAERGCVEHLLRGKGGGGG